MPSFAPAALPLWLALALAAAVPTAQAAGYRIGTQSAAAEGTAGANGAEAADASTLFANPAGITRLPGLNFSASVEQVDPSIRFTDAGSVINLHGSGLAPRPISAVGDTQRPGVSATIPRLYLSWQASPQLTAGIGLFVPLGAKLAYDDHWGGRYNIQQVELKTLALNPNLAFKVSPTLSLAAGLTVQKMDGRLQRAVPYGSVYAAGLLAAAQRAAAAGAPGLALQLQQQAAQAFGNSTYDGSVVVQGSSWAVGWNLALLWDLNADTRLGVAWRSGIRHTLKGRGDWTQPATLPATALAAATGTPYGPTQLDHNDSDAQLRVHSPDTLSLQAWHQVTPSVALMADATWARESNLQQLRIDFANTTPDSITAEHWKNTWSVALGANWQATPALLLRAGLALDRSPVPSATRGPALPDAHRTWTTLGARWQFSPRTSVDFALARVKVDDAAMNATDDGEGETPCNCTYANVRGNYRSRATSVGVQVNHAF